MYELANSVFIISGCAEGFVVKEDVAGSWRRWSEVFVLVIEIKFFELGSERIPKIDSDGHEIVKL